MGIFDIFKKTSDSDKEEANPIVASLVSAGFEINDLKVTNNEGVVEISGNLENGDSINNITNFLQRTPGINKVINRITVTDQLSKEIMFKVVTKVRFLNVRKGPSTDFDIKGKFENGEEVQLIKKATESWYKVKGKTLEGYCNTDYLKPL